MFGPMAILLYQVFNKNLEPKADDLNELFIAKTEI